jgi:hypothetical protein
MNELSGFCFRREPWALVYGGSTKKIAKLVKVIMNVTLRKKILPPPNKDSLVFDLKPYPDPVARFLKVTREAGFLFSFNPEEVLYV